MADFNYGSFIWGIAEKLRGTYRRSDNGKVILPFTVLRRLDCVLQPTKQAVLDAAKEATGDGVAKDFILQRAAGYAFYNTSPYDLRSATGDPTNLRQNLQAYVDGFSPNVRDVFDKYDFASQLVKLDKADLLLLVTQDFLSIDLHPEKVDNTDMGNIFEELIGKAMEASNEESGEYFTPRDVVRLMVALIFNPDGDALTTPGAVRSIYDPTSGTGGMLSVADNYIRSLNPNARLTLYGQEFNEESYAISKTDLLIHGQQAENIIYGDTLIDDGHHGKTFDYGLANPPYGVEWKKQQAAVTREHETMGFNGRFGPGLPTVKDGQLLFVLHLVSKMRPVNDGGGRVGIILNGSPLFNGNAGSGESEIRRWLLEQDLVEAIIAMPKDMFYNTGIATYIWLLDNNKPANRKKKVQLIDGSSHFAKLRKNVGSKRNEISDQHLRDLVKLYDEFEEGEFSKIFNTTDFGYTTITVEQPLRQSWALSPDRIETALATKPIEKLTAGEREHIHQALLSESAKDDSPTTDAAAFTNRVKTALGQTSLTTPQLKTLVAALGSRDKTAPIVTDAKGKPVADAGLRDTENVPLSENIEEYASREIAPHVDDFWLDRSKDKVGYEIPFTRHFYKYVPPRPLEEIDNDLNNLIAEITTLLKEVEK